MSTWSVVYERTDNGWSAYVPALPGRGSGWRGPLEMSPNDLYEKLLRATWRAWSRMGFPSPPQTGLT